MATISLQGLVTLYDLQPHPEGGYFKETYRDKGIIEKSALPPQFGGNRNISTAIYFLLPEGKNLICTALNPTRSGIFIWEGR